MKNWGYELKEHRQERGMTQLELANKVGVSPRTVSFWETGDRGMTLAHAEKAFRILGAEFVLMRIRT